MITNEFSRLNFKGNTTIKTPNFASTFRREKDWQKYSQAYAYSICRNRNLKLELKSNAEGSKCILLTIVLLLPTHLVVAVVGGDVIIAVSYTHLTLPTIYSV